MREILFRGKRVDNGEWVYGSFLQVEHDDNSLTTAIFHKKNAGGDAEVSSYTVGQFTGLTDKNDKKVFEGDIIKCKVHEMNGYRVRRGVVEYHGVGFIMNLDPNSWYDQKNISFDCEVIGNIYDNPELLEV